MLNSLGRCIIATSSSFLFYPHMHNQLLTPRLRAAYNSAHRLSLGYKILTAVTCAILYMKCCYFAFRCCRVSVQQYRQFLLLLRMSPVFAYELMSASFAQIVLFLIFLPILYYLFAPAPLAFHFLFLS